MPLRLVTLLSLLCFVPILACSGLPTDDDDTSGDDDDTSGDDDSSSGDDDDSAGGAVWQQCASAGNTPEADGWTGLITAPAGLFADGDSTLNGSGSGGITDPSWGAWSQSGGSARATRSLHGGALQVGDSVSLEFDNGWVESPGSASAGEVGISWHADGAELLRFSFHGGESEYQIRDANESGLSLGLPYSTDGMRVTLAQSDAGTYELYVNDVLLRSGNYATSALLAEEISVFSIGAGPGPNDHDLYFNCLTITR